MNSNPSVQAVLAAVSAESGVDPLMICLARRGPVLRLRKRVMRDAVEAGCTYSEIARALGYDRTTVAHHARGGE